VNDDSLASREVADDRIDNTDCIRLRLRNASVLDRQLPKSDAVIAAHLLFSFEIEIEDLGGPVQIQYA
jgi:hypothetical protein